LINQFLNTNVINLNHPKVKKLQAESKFKFSFHCKHYAKKNLERMFYLFYTLSQVLGKDIIPILLNYTFLTEVKTFADCQKLGFQEIKDDFNF
jgi:hypothetical protein